MQAARTEWDAQAAEDWSEDTFSPAEHRRRRAQPDACPNKCRSIATYVHRPENEAIVPTALRVLYWYRHGATDVNTQRYEINRYRRPSKSNRSADLGGPEQAAGVRPDDQGADCAKAVKYLRFPLDFTARSGHA